MADSEWPAWPFLLGAVVLVSVGFWQVARGSALGWVFVAGALLLFAVALRQGRRAMAAGGGAAEPVAEPASVPEEKGGGLSAYYDNEEAVRAMQKESRRLCKTCGSPVLEKASECPTCGSSV